MSSDRFKIRDDILLDGANDLGNFIKEIFGALGGFALLFWLLGRTVAMDIVFGAMSFVFLVGLSVGLFAGIIALRQMKPNKCTDKHNKKETRQ